MPNVQGGRRMPRKRANLRHNRATARAVKKVGKELLRDEMVQKFLRETLPAHLKGTPKAMLAAKLVTELGPGVVMGTKQLIALLDKYKDVGHTLIPTEGDFTLLQETPTFAEPSKIGQEMGSVYKKAIKLTVGVKHDAQMKAAKKLYKSQTWPCFNSQSKKYYGEDQPWKALTAEAGFNRQGVWTVKNYNEVHGGATNEAGLEKNGYLSPMLLKMQMFQEMKSYLIAPSVLAWLEVEENNSADVFYAINSVTDVMTYANAMQFLPVELKIYICKCKTRTKWSPAGSWFVPDGTPDGEDYMTSDYVYPSGPPLDLSYPGYGQTVTGFKETSVHVGSTPFYSPRFRNHWDVEKVVKQIIQPTDKFELHLVREFRHAHSIRNLHAEFNDLSKGYYCEGDYAICCTFKGLPCFMKFATGTPSNTDLDIKEVDCSPAKILMTSRSSMNITAPSLFQTSMIQTAEENPNYISGIGRVLDTELDHAAFNDNSWKINVITNLEDAKEGGER